MKQLQYLLLLLAGTMSLLSTSVAQEKMMDKKNDKMMEQKMDKMMSMTFKGYLVDKLCGAGFAKKDMKTAETKAMKHTTACALEDQCKESGYGLVIDGKYYKLDARGDQLAVDYLMRTKKESNLEVEVAGSKKGEMIAVISIKDAMMKDMDGKM